MTGSWKGDFKGLDSYKGMFTLWFASHAKADEALERMVTLPHHGMLFARLPGFQVLQKSGELLVLRFLAFGN